VISVHILCIPFCLTTKENHKQLKSPNPFQASL
jgi:hypothetical protein